MLHLENGNLDPDAPAAELAYITKAEKDLILKKDIHGSLSKGPNMGPSGIMSLDSFGDIGGGLEQVRSRYSSSGEASAEPFFWSRTK